MLIHRRQFDADLEEEIRLHLELRQQQLRSGMPEEDARSAARRRFGNATYLKEESRIAWGWEWLENAIQDARYGLRVLRRSPGFSAVAILTLAVGIGATTAIFSIVDATLLHVLPYSHPEQLVSIVDDLPGIGAQDIGMSVPEWHDLQRSGIFEYVSPIGGGDVNLTGASQPERIRFLNVSPNYPTLLGVKPQLGHLFNPEDQTPGFTLEALISDGLWKRAFGADPAILGKNLRLDNDLYHVVGVMPPGFHDPGRTTDERNNEIWLASGFAAAPAPPPDRSFRIFPRTIARLKAGLTMTTAQSQLDAFVAALQKEFPKDYPTRSAWTLRLTPLKESVVGNVRQSLILLLGAVGLVLLIGCVNVANLLLARASGRGRELAVRQALGGGRKRLTAQLLTESLVLSLAGGIVGLAILVSTKAFLLRILPDSLPRLNEISINWTVLLFALVTSLAAGIIFGLAPALNVGRFDLTHALNEAVRGSTGSGQQARTRRLLVISEFALSLVLLIAAGLLLRSFWDLLNVRPGFNPENVLAMHVWLPVPNDPKTDIYGSAAQETPFLREVVRRAKTLSGVEEAAIGNRESVPLGHSRNDLGSVPLIFEGQTDAAQAPSVRRSDVTPGYFHLLGMTLLRGRTLIESDDSAAPPVAVVNDAFAQTYWPNTDPLGKHFKVIPTNGPWITVVGVLANSRTESLADPTVPQFYLSAYQRRAKDLSIFLRGHLDLAAIPAQLREQVQAVDPELPVFGAKPLTLTVSESLSERRFSMEMVGLFALTALLLAGMGIYGVISYLVSERTHEIGIRLALGAGRTNILKMVLQQGLRLAAAGTALGLICALIVSRLMAGLLYGVRPADPLTFIVVAALLIAVALLACYIPARRAVRIDPLAALKYE
jgi:putative ABC transport system permease protein